MCNKNQSRCEQARKLAGTNPNIETDEDARERTHKVKFYWRKHLNKHWAVESDELVNITFEYGFFLPAAVSQLNPGISPNLKTFVSKERFSLSLSAQTDLC